MARKLLQSEEVLADSEGQQRGDLAPGKKPLIQDEDKVTQHDDNCAIYDSKGNKQCNCPASRK